MSILNWSQLFIDSGSVQANKNKLFELDFTPERFGGYLDTIFCWISLSFTYFGKKTTF